MSHSRRLLSVGWAVAASLCASDARAAGPQRTSAEVLQGARRFYESVASVHLVARANIQLPQPDGTKPVTGTGTFEYWAAGDKYRIRCVTDRNLGLMADVEYAYDGSRFYFLDFVQNVLSVQALDADALPTAIPNPFFAPLDFLSRDDDDCGACVLKLSRLRDGGLWNARTSALAVSSADGDGALLVGQDAILRRQRIGLKPRITTRGGRIEKVDLARDDGSLFSSTVAEYAPASDRAQPLLRRVSTKGYDARGVVIAAIDFTISILEINEPLPSGMFAIPEEIAATVWDSDAKAFLHTPGRR